MNTTGNLGLCYYNLGDTDRALQTFDEIDNYYRKLGGSLNNTQLQGWEHDKGHLARTYLLLKRYGEAKRAYGEAIQDARDSDDTDFLARAGIDIRVHRNARVRPGSET